LSREFAYQRSSVNQFFYSFFCCCWLLWLCSFLYDYSFVQFFIVSLRLSLCLVCFCIKKNISKIALFYSDFSLNCWWNREIICFLYNFHVSRFDLTLFCFILCGDQILILHKLLVGCNVTSNFIFNIKSNRQGTW
jgi:hypothetical protein